MNTEQKPPTFAEQSINTERMMAIADNLEAEGLHTMATSVRRITQQRDTMLAGRTCEGLYKAADWAAVRTWRQTNSCEENKRIIAECFVGFLSAEVASPDEALKAECERLRYHLGAATTSVRKTARVAAKEIIVRLSGAHSASDIMDCICSHFEGFTSVAPAALDADKLSAAIHQKLFPNTGRYTSQPNSRRIIADLIREHLQGSPGADASP